MHPPIPIRRHGRTAIASLLAALVILALVPLPRAAAQDEPAEDLASRFTLAVLPDTQFYSRYARDQFEPRYGANPFQVQTRWLADHADELNIPFVAHLGDVVDRAGNDTEWEVADEAMEVLEAADVPYSVLPGNHDVQNSDDSLDDTDYDLSREKYLDWFGPGRSDREFGPTYGGSDPTGLNEWHVFEGQGQEFLVLALAWRSSPETMAWAQQVIDDHPGVPTILTSHSILGIQADAVSPLETGYGLELWDTLIAPNDQIFMTLNGHSHGSTRLEKLNDAGNPVMQILMDYQMAYDGGNGYLGLFEFDLTAERVTVQTGSPWVVAKDPEVLTPYDQALLTGEHQQYSFDVDFSGRFPGFEPGPADQPDLAKTARDILLDGFEAPDGIALEQPGSREDYVPVEGTVAHWRFDGPEGVVTPDMVFEDIAGDADLHRVDPAESGSPTAEMGDVTLTRQDVNPFAADGAAVCFDDADQREERFSYLTSPADVPATTHHLTDGYTIETFVKIADDWTAPANQWSKFLVRTGNRSMIEGVPWSQWDYTASPVALGLSNLREFQWTEIPAEATRGDRTAWSGEIILGRWVHVAIVNDAEAETTTMYVDGAPVLRNATGTGGHALNEGMPWIFGADWVDDAPRNGWHGCIGETRVLDHPTGPESWLTARPDIDTLTVDAPEGTLPVGTDEVVLSGTGTPRAEVTLGGDLDGATTVAEDGTWSITAAVRGGAVAWTATQGFGTRTADPVTGTFRVEVPSTPADPGDEDPDAEDPDDEAPDDEAPDDEDPTPAPDEDGWWHSPFDDVDGMTARAAGADRIATAVELSRASFDRGVPAAVLVRADAFADAVSAGPAAAHLGGPVLLAGDELPAATAAELERLQPQQIVVVGGEQAVSAAAADAAAAFTDGPVVRHSGPNRFATSAAVLDGVFGDDVPLVLATGSDFPDALGGGVLAGRTGGAVLLVDGAAPALPEGRSPEHVTILGGPAALPAALDDQVAAATGAEVTRIAGATRYETAALVARAAFPEGSDAALLATGGAFADALAGVPVAILSDAPLLLTAADELPAPTAAYLGEHRPRVLLLGGTQAVSAEVEAALAALLTES